MDTWLRFYLKRVREHGGLLSNVRKSIIMHNIPQHYGVAALVSGILSISSEQFPAYGRAPG
jgi:hypothetical protein